jgi:hypothetical protein
MAARWDKPSQPPEGQTHADGEWVWQDRYESESCWFDPGWVWIRKSSSSDGCMIFIAVGLLGLGGGIAALFV